MPADTILLVEDDHDLRFAYELILRHAGYNLVIAENGKIALDMLAEHTPRLILLDIFMPVLDGKGFLENLSQAQRDSLDIIVCSNTSDADIINDMKRLGASEIVLKASLDPSGLTELVSSRLAT